MAIIKRFLKTHVETVLIFSALLFLVIIAAFLYETIEIVIAQSARVIATPVQQNGAGFDLQNAAKIDFKGIPGSGSSTTSGMATQ